MTPLSDPLPDNDIMRLVQAGEIARLSVLFDRYSDRLFGFFVRYTGRRDVSEDLVQDVFLRILRYRASFRSDAPFSAWMFQLARNAAADHFTKWKNEQPLGDHDAERRSPDAHIHDLMVEREDLRLLHRALGALSPDKRLVVLLSRFEDLTYEEIGRIVDAPVGTIKARVHYALKDLKAEFTRLGGERPAGISTAGG